MLTLFSVDQNTTDCLK